MSDLSSLIARVEKAEGPSYSLEVEIAYLTGFWPAERIDRVTRADDGHVLVWFTEGPDLPLPPAVLSSIDAAVSLAERVLPNWHADIDLLSPPPMSDKYGARLFDANGSWQNIAAEAVTPAIALVLATLRALQQKGSSDA